MTFNQSKERDEGFDNLLTKINQLPYGSSARNMLYKKYSEIYESYDSQKLFPENKGITEGDVQKVSNNEAALTKIIDEELSKPQPQTEPQTKISRTERKRENAKYRSSLKVHDEIVNKSNKELIEQHKQLEPYQKVIEKLQPISKNYNNSNQSYRAKKIIQNSNTLIENIQNAQAEINYYNIATKLLSDSNRISNLDKENLSEIITGINYDKNVENLKKSQKALDTLLRPFLIKNETNLATQRKQNLDEYLNKINKLY